MMLIMVEISYKLWKIGLFGSTPKKTQKSVKKLIIFHLSWNCPRTKLWYDTKHIISKYCTKYLFIICCPTVMSGKIRIKVIQKKTSIKLHCGPTHCGSWCRHILTAIAPRKNIPLFSQPSMARKRSNRAKKMTNVKYRTNSWQNNWGL